MQSSLDFHTELACRWLESCQSPSGGWGWVADVVPNPQNTAEVVVALSCAGRAPEDLAHLVESLAQTEVAWPDGRRWIFDTPIDYAWRLRGLARLPRTTVRDQYMSRALRELRRQFTGKGWRMAADSGESTFSTAVGLVAVGEISIQETAPRLAESYLPAWRWLLEDLRRPANQDCIVAHTAWALLAVSEPAFHRWRDASYRRSIRAGVERLHTYLAGPIPTEEEPFSRGEVRDKWRHPNLAVVIQALLRVSPGYLFDPLVRRRFLDLMSQQRRDTSREDGAFGLHEGGPVTTYSTTHGIQTMTVVKAAFMEASPADLLDLFCTLDGRHHSDAQKILTGPGGFTLLINSTAGFAVGTIFTLIVSLFLAFALGAFTLTDLSRKILVCILVYFLACGWYGYPAARLKQTSNRTVALAMYGVITALILPTITYIIT
jgi:Prenyltransferase and squalene oxidase repeat